MHRPVAVLLAEMDSQELQGWQVFLTWREADRKQRAKDAAFCGDEDDVSYL